MATDVHSWLKSGRNYNEGVQLLRDHGKSSWLIEMLEKGPDHYNTPKLVREIEKIAAKGSKQLPVGSRQLAVCNHGSQPVEPPPIGEAPAKKPAALFDGVSNKDLQKKLRIKAQIKELFTEIVFLKAQLSTLPEGPRLHECSRNILLKDFKRLELWDEINFFEREGKWFDELPENEKKVADVGNPAELERKIKNLMANRSKAAGHLDKPLMPGKKAFYEKKVAALTAEIEQLQKLRA